MNIAVGVTVPRSGVAKRGPQFHGNRCPNWLDIDKARTGCEYRSPSKSFGGDEKTCPARQSDSAPPALIPFVLRFLELVLESCTLWAVGHVRHPFAKLVLSLPEVLAMLRVLGRGSSAIPGRRRRGRSRTKIKNGPS